MENQRLAYRTVINFRGLSFRAGLWFSEPGPGDNVMNSNLPDPSEDNGNGGPHPPNSAPGPPGPPGSLPDIPNNAPDAPQPPQPPVSTQRGSRRLKRTNDTMQCPSETCLPGQILRKTVKEQWCMLERIAEDGDTRTIAPRSRVARLRFCKSKYH